MNVFLGPSYENIDKNQNKYNIRFGIYGNSKKNTGLKYFPFLIYDYVYHNIPSNINISDCIHCYYDVITLGCSLLFSDIGIESSYSWIDENTHEVSLKIYLWEFGK